MNIRLGNIQFDQIRERTGFELGEENRDLWNKYHSQNAGLADKESCFHVFDMPLCITYKGDEAMKAIKSMFSPSNLKEFKGEFTVYQEE